MKRLFRDRDFIETKENMLFCVIGNVHPQNKVISYLKYIPWENKKAARLGWKKGGIEYGRILPYYSAQGVLQTQEYLKSKFPKYVYLDPYLNIEITEIPHEDIKEHHKPEERVKEIIKKPKDSLEEKVKEMISIISRESNTPTKFFGVTGSILAKIHNPKISDIDITVYGLQSALKVREAINMLLTEKGEFRKLNKKEMEKHARNISIIHDLSFEEALKLLNERWNTGKFKEKFFSIHPVKLEEEVKEKHEDKMFKPKGMVKIRCKVIDSSEAIFYPCKYLVNEVKIIEGPKTDTIKEIVSYEGIFCDIATVNEEIIVKGKLEEVQDKDKNETYHRVQIGSFEAKSKNYIKPIRWFKENRNIKT